MISSGSHLKYANALNKVAEKTGSAENVLRDLEKLESIFGEEKIKNILKKIAYLERGLLEKLLRNVFEGKVHILTINLLIMLAGRRKLGLLPKVRETYSRLYHSSKGIREVMVRTARKLDSEEELSLIDKLQNKFDRPVSAKFSVNADLIGGMQIYERGYLTDYSLKNHLERLEKALMESGT